MIQFVANQTKVEVVALRQLMPAQQAHCGVAMTSAYGIFRRLTLRSATEFSQRENFHLGYIVDLDLS